MTQFILAAVVLIAACSQRSATDSPASGIASDTLKVGETRLQRFSAKTGAVLIKGYTDIGAIAVANDARISVTAHEATDASDGSRAEGLTIEVVTEDRVSGRSTSYVDFDEIESLMAGLDYISKVDKSATRMTDFQADYRTRGDLRLSTFNRDDGTIWFAVASGTIGATSAYLPLNRAPEFKALLSRGLSAIVAARAAKPGR